MANSLDKTIESWAGKNIEFLRDTPSDEIRKYVEQRTGKTIYVFGSPVVVDVDYQ